MKPLFHIVVNLLLVFTAFTTQAQEKWALESVFIRNKLPLIRLSDDYITIRPNDIMAFSPYIFQKLPSFQGLLTNRSYVRNLDLNTLNQREYYVGARWMKSSPNQTEFLGASQLEAWVSVRPKFYHSVNIQRSIQLEDEVGDTISNFYYRAFLYRKQIGLGLSYNVQLYGHKRWRIYSGVQLGYNLEYGGRLQEGIGDAHIISNPNDSTSYFYQPINWQNQTINVAIAPTHIFVAGFQLGVDYTLHKRIQLFGLVQTQLMAAKNADAKTDFSKGFAVPASLGIRYLLKPGKTRVIG